MERLTPLDPATATGQNIELFAAIHGKLGMVPNMMRTFAQSPAVLGGYLGLSAALGTGQLSAKLGELLALTVAEVNGCDYCLAAHTTIATQLLHVPAEVVREARAGHGADARTTAALTFARALVTRRGQVSDTDMQAVRAAGYSEGEVAEIVAHVALNIFTNYFNLAANTTVDFPIVEALEPAIAV